MRFSTYSLLRLVFMAILTSWVAGVVVNRLAMVEGPAYTLDFRQPWAVGKHLFAYSRKGDNLILDTASGQRLELKRESGRNYDMFSFSPFIAADGQRPLIARIQNFSSEGIEFTPGRIEMARLNYPSGELADKRELDWLPDSGAAWDPQTSRGLSCLFSTGAGHLMRLDWTDERGMVMEHQGDRVEWDVEPPFGVHTFLAEPSWLVPTEGLAGPRLLASIWGVDPETKSFHVGLVWLELDSARTRILDYGFLIDMNLGREKDRLNLRYPVARADAAGHLHAFWYEKQFGQQGWTLQHASLGQVVESAGKTAYRLGESESLATGCVATSPGFEPGLRSVYYLVAPEPAARYDMASWRQVSLSSVPGLLVASGGRAVKSQKPKH